MRIQDLTKQMDYLQKQLKEHEDIKYSEWLVYSFFNWCFFNWTVRQLKILFRCRTTLESIDDESDNVALETGGRIMVCSIGRNLTIELESKKLVS